MPTEAEYFDMIVNYVGTDAVQRNALRRLGVNMVHGMAVHKLFLNRVSAGVVYERVWTQAKALEMNGRYTFSEE